ncbi:hypothetical protein [Pseudoalteromonas sp. ASV78]|uniref:hypothetical protein n=1 Tax=Pseudoalteromonas sp. ASV78 TaxID=3397851 RepID=UPI0039FC4169
MARPISIENAEHYNWSDDCDGWHLVKSAALSVIQERVPPGCCEQAHKHEFAEQFFFVLKWAGYIDCGFNKPYFKSAAGPSCASGVSASVMQLC